MSVEKLDANIEIHSALSTDPVIGDDIETTDELYDLYQESKKYDEQTLEADSVKVKRKLDLMLMPFLMFTYLLSFLDKQTLNYSNAYGLQEDTGMVGDDYSWAASASNFGYLVGAYPMNFMLQRYPNGKVLSCFVFVWGVFCLLTSTAKSFPGFFAIRFFLGLVEAIIAPACMNLTALFYKREEQSLRMSLWLGVNGIATILGGLISWGSGHADTAVASWQLIYLIVGAITCFWSFVIFFILPDSPKNAKMLNHYEKVVAVYRIAKNNTGAKNKQYKPYQIKEAFMDPKSYFLWSIELTLGLLNGGVANFTSSLFKGFGFTGLTSTKLQMAGGAVELFSCVVCGIATAYIPNIVLICISLAAMPGLAGMVGILTIPLRLKYHLAACTWLQNTFGASIILTWSIPSMNVTGHTKRSSVIGLGFVLYAAGNIISPHFFDPVDSPRYKPAATGLLTCYSYLILAPWAFGLYLYLENKRRDKKGYIVSDRDEILAGFEDKTDMENKGFRYKR